MNPKTKLLAGAAGLFGLGALLIPYAVAQGQGGFTQAQADAGHSVYAANCAGCHRANLAGGGDAPALGGAGFMSSFGNRSTKDLYNFIANSMPVGRPGSLSEFAREIIKRCPITEQEVQGINRDRGIVDASERFGGCVGNFRRLVKHSSDEVRRRQLTAGNPQSAGRGGALKSIVGAAEFVDRFSKKTLSDKNTPGPLLLCWIRS